MEGNIKTNEILIFCKLKLYHVNLKGLNNLNGMLPSEIGNAKALTVLDLREFMQSLLIICMASLIFFVYSLFLHKKALVGMIGMNGKITN